MTRALSDADFATSPEERGFEDYHVGAVYEFGHLTMDQDRLLEFAREFDPQPMHADPVFADAGPYAGLIASGWHTGAILLRLYVDHYLPHGAASLGSPGMDELRWPAPVRPGDLLRLRVEIVETKRSRSKPDRGLVIAKTELLNQNDKIVFSASIMNLIMMRDPSAG